MAMVEKGFTMMSSSVVRALAHDAMGRRIDPSTGVTKTMVCAIMSVG